MFVAKFFFARNLSIIWSLWMVHVFSQTSFRHGLSNQCLYMSVKIELDS